MKEPKISVHYSTEFGSRKSTMTLKELERFIRRGTLKVLSLQWIEEEETQVNNGEFVRPAIHFAWEAGCFDGVPNGLKENVKQFLGF